MKKTIRIENWKDIHIGDMLFVKGCRDGFRVRCVRPVGVDDPFGHGFAYVHTDKFDHTERTIEVHEWPEAPKDDEVHWYKDNAGGIIGYEQGYWYMMPFTDDGKSREDAIKWYSDSLPLTEMKLVPKD